METLDVKKLKVRLSKEHRIGEEAPLFDRYGSCLECGSLSDKALCDDPTG
jgi:hypothetical protein